MSWHDESMNRTQHMTTHTFAFELEAAVGLLKWGDFFILNMVDMERWVQPTPFKEGEAKG